MTYLFISNDITAFHCMLQFSFASVEDKSSSR